MNLQDVKNMMIEFGIQNLTSDAVIIIENGNVRIKNSDIFKANMISLYEAWFEFSGNFNDEVIESFLTELNGGIKTSKKYDLVKLHNEYVSKINKK